MKLNIRLDLNINRREWLKLAGAGAAYATLAGCGTLTRSPKGPPYARPLSALPFGRPNIDAAQITRTLVGLRPYRAAGFVVRGERVGEKTIIHNYGHGGGGITLSWGSSALAVAEAPDLAIKNAAVIGCGVMGLSTARLLQERGWNVTIYAKDLPPNTTSNIAGGQWAPTSVFSPRSIDEAFAAQFRQALLISHQLFSKLVDIPGYGVSLRENYHLNANPTTAADFFYLRDYPELFPSIAELAPDDHPFAAPYVLRHVTMLIEPSTYLPRLMRDITEASGKITLRAFQQRDELLTLDEPVIFNCTGLGSRELFNDTELTPVRGQLVLMPPDERVDYLTHGGMNGGNGLLYMFPRADGILLGGAYERGANHLEADAETTARIVSEHARLFQNLRI